MRIATYFIIALILTAGVAGSGETEKSTANSGPQTGSICCDWDREWRVHLMPHPNQCWRFYLCRPMQSSNGRTYLDPLPQNCPKDAEGNTLYFDFPTCKCVWRDEVTCYNDGNRDHYHGFFNCSDKFYEGGNTLACYS